ncbi:hypothetical protein Acor_02690 [Acrocarpospora corrugata]|uniref:RCC1-like domain-containing protein n=1 Tax=Acrocarpospora corrugata TaxID=35763 RepID=A0A5M3VUZ3_9ACTN|nr:hypothetical protein [Acrocarpospora corrugata]GER98207.1 hypothetical protein Acor_02690 [Acrocarpospora corrugata]
MPPAGPAHGTTPDVPTQLMGWGSNSAGQVTAGPAVLPLPVPVPGGLDFVDASTGTNHSVALAKDGRVWSWGANNSGQLGDGTDVSRTEPAPVPGLTDIVEVRAGSVFSVALDSHGRVYSWGVNTSGRLGLGSVDAGRSTPTRIPSLGEIAQIDVSLAHVLARRSDGTVWSWGSNLVGELGYGTAPYSAFPTMVPGLADVVDVAAGDVFSLALRRDGTVSGWGSNAERQLGNADAGEIRLSPGYVAGPISGVADLEAGGDFVMVLLSDGTLRTWGSNVRGQLGIHSPVGNAGAPAKLQIARVTQISAARRSALALTDDSRAYSWGVNALGILGIGDLPTEMRAPTEITALPGGTVALASSGVGGHMLALRTDSPLFQVKLNPAAGTLVLPSGLAPAGAQANTWVSIASVGSYRGSVTLKATGLPPGIKATFSPPIVSSGESAQLTLSGVSLETGPYTIAVTGTSAFPLKQVSATYTLTLADSPPPAPDGPAG